MYLYILILTAYYLDNPRMAAMITLYIGIFNHEEQYAIMKLYPLPHQVCFINRNLTYTAANEATQPR